MKHPNHSASGWIWLSCLILFVCVCATGIAFFSRMGGFLPSDAGAISLFPVSAGETESDSQADLPTAEKPSAPETNAPLPETNAATSPQQGSESAEGAGIGGAHAPNPDPPRRPGFELSDGKGVWSTDTQIEIFRVSYENGEQIITVQSQNGDKLIAPGTENTYTFKLKNTGDVAMDYLVEVEAYFTPGDIVLPLTARLSRYDGIWLVGSEENYESMSALDGVEDYATLGAGKYTSYDLDWCWPFEGDDAYDTYLGNLAEEQDLTFTIRIRTTATESADPDDPGGITPPQTGDDTHLILMLLLSFGALVMTVLLAAKPRRRRDDRSEAV